MDLRGKVAIVTGSSRGIGRAVALRFAGAGARVVVNYRQNEAAADEVKRSIEAAGGEAMLARGSVDDADFVNGMVAATIDRFGRLDVLVNNAGVLTRQFAMMTKPEAWRASLDVNLTGAFLCARAALRPFIGQRSGCVVNMASVAAFGGLPGQVSYASAKAGLVGLTRALAVEVARFGVRVNAIAPGYIATDMLDEKDAGEAVKSVPLGRLGAPDEVAHLALFLASDLASYVTGQVMVVDGGLSI